MKHTLILTHGKFAEGIQDSLKMIVGSLDYIHTECISDEDTPETTQNAIRTFLKVGSSEDPHIIITDIPGGSSTRFALPFASEKNVYVVSGLNLALLLEIVLGPEEGLEEHLKNAIETAKTSMLYINDLVNDMKEQEEK